MSMESLYKLSILVNMIDRVSGPAAKITGKIGETASSFQKYSAGVADMARDGVVLMGTGYQIAKAAVAPVKATFETQDALAELSSLGVEKLGALEDAAAQFSNTWAGTNKAQFLTAAYDIKSGIASLSDEGVAEYTNLAGVTAKATKSTVNEMTSLFATGYGIYKDFYGDLSDLEFGQVFSAGISQSVKQFKTTGSGMAQSISALGASATSARVPLEEQLSILGMLQATMSGSEAGTKYTAFLQSAAKAGQELGLRFTDASGQLKSMPEILGAIQGKFGDILTASDKLELQKAFGTVEAVKLIELLYGKTDDLQTNIVDLYDTMGKGMDVTEEMANRINAPPAQGWELLKQKMQTTLETVGNAMLPRFVELQESLDDIANKVVDLANKHPQLISNVIFTAGALGTFLTVLGGLKLGLGSIGALITSVIKIWNVFTGAINGVKYATFLAKYGLYNLKGALGTLGGGILKAGAGLKTLTLGMYAWVKQAIMSAMAALPGLIGAVWSFTAALLANPITWIVLGIVALIAALVLLWKNWDAVTAFLQNTWNAVCDGIASAISWVREKLEAVPDSFKIILAAVMPFIGIPLLIIEHWDTIKAFFANLPENIKQGFLTLKQWFMDFFTGLGETFRQSGTKILTTFTEGIKSAASKPIEAVKGTLQKIRNMLPFSDAREGPLSRLTLSGRRVLETFNGGIQLSATKPVDAVKGVLGKIRDLMTLGGDPENPFNRLTKSQEEPEDDGVRVKHPPPGESDGGQGGGAAAPIVRETENVQKVRQFVIQQLDVNLKLSDADIHTWRRIKQLIADMLDDVNSSPDEPEPEIIF